MFPVSPTSPGSPTAYLWLKLLTSLDPLQLIVQCSRDPIVFFLLTWRYSVPVTDQAEPA
jgi:hypothetical protein